MNIYSISPSESFVDILAQRLLQEIHDPIELRNYIVLLPNRRACRSFIKCLSQQQMVFEPLVFPFGDIDLTQIAPELCVNKTIISETKRQAILMQLLSQHKGQAKQIAVLADKLASLIDQANWEEVPLANIASIVPQDLAAHWEVVLNFLKIVYEHWPKILDDMNMIEASSLKPLLMRSLAAHWAQNGSKHIVIAAGSTGSIPATANLIKTVANLSNGQVFLPGLDTQMPEASWQQVDLSHYQYNLKQLCEFIGVERRDVKQLGTPHNRERLITEVLSPVPPIRHCEHREEILILKQVQDDKNGLLRCARNDGPSIIECQDSHQEARVIALIMRQTLQHPNKTVGLVSPDRSLVKRVTHELKRWGLCADDSGGHPLLETLEAVEFENSLTCRGDTKAAIELRKIYDEIIANLETYPPIPPEEFPEFLRYQISKASIRTPHGFHPRLFIYGTVEARTQKTDVMILSGLNEGVWPGSASADPWLNRGMRAELQLPLPEKRVGLAAHDFVQGFCAKEVYLTRAEKSGGAPTVASRWLLKLKTHLNEYNKGEDLLGWARQMDLPATITPCSRPQPNPAVALRPKKLSVTQIEKLIVDPYSIYASKILNLKPKSKDEERRLRGIVVHEVLETLAEQDFHGLIQLAAEKINHYLPNSPRNTYWLYRFATTAQWLLAQQRAAKTYTEIQGTLVLANSFMLTARADRLDQKSDGTVDIIDYKTGVVPTKAQVASGQKPQITLEALIFAKSGFIIDRCQFWKIGGGKKPGEITDVLIDDIENIEQNVTNLTSKFIFSNIPFYPIPRPLFTPEYNDYEHLARVKEWTK